MTTVLNLNHEQNILEGQNLAQSNTSPWTRSEATPARG